MACENIHVVVGNIGYNIFNISTHYIFVHLACTVSSIQIPPILRSARIHAYLSMASPKGTCAVGVRRPQSQFVNQFFFSIHLTMLRR